MIFVFGSNLAGRHGAGSARHAMQHHGAVYGQGSGLHGHSYAIPTKDSKLKTLPLFEIRNRVSAFLRFAEDYPLLQFEVVEIGCGLAGYKPEQIAPMFRQTPANVNLSNRFKAILADQLLAIHGPNLGDRLTVKEPTE